MTNGSGEEKYNSTVSVLLDNLKDISNEIKNVVI